MRRLTGLLLSLEHDHPTVDTMLEQLAAWEKDLAAAAAPDPTPRIGQGGETQRVYLDHAFDIGAFNPCFPEYTFDGTRRRNGVRQRHLPGGLRRPAGAGARRVPRRLLRLRHPASELRGEAHRQDQIAHRDVPAADTHPHRTPIRHRANAIRRKGHVDRAAASRRRGVVHRRGQHGRFVTRQADRLPVRQAAGRES